jgi:heme-degrading monooxygenase HmoA
MARTRNCPLDPADCDIISEIFPNIPMTCFADTPEPPYYAVIFTSTRTAGDHGYAEMAENMLRLAARQAGFLGFESAREELGISVSYWADLDSIRRWKADIAHREAQRLGRAVWYSGYRVRISKVEHEYGMDSSK